jgi:hypothetical protein
LHVLAAIDRDIGAGHERRPVRAQVDDKTCNFFGLAEASERDLRQDLSWDSPDDSRTGVNIIAFPSSLEDRREVRTATGTLVIGMKTFGASTPLKELQRKYGFEPERVTEVAKELLGRIKRT